MKHSKNCAIVKNERIFPKRIFCVIKLTKGIDKQQNSVVKAAQEVETLREDQIYVLNVKLEMNSELESY